MTPIKERSTAFTFKGAAHTLLGDELKVGDTAPIFVVTANDLTEKSLEDYAGKMKVLISTPSLDTGVCDTQTRKFNEEAAGFSQDIVVLTISVDLPFAQKRFCQTAGIDRVITLSDHRYRSFGVAYGVLIKELQLLNRAIFIVDQSNKIRYIEVATEMTSPLNYDAALAVIKKVI